MSLAALERLGLDEVWWLVSPQNPLKPVAGMAPFAARLASARTQARHPRIRVSAIEAELGTRLTVDTVQALRRRFPQLRFLWLMGADNLQQFHRWADWRGIARTVPIVVMARPGYAAGGQTAPAMGWLRRFRHRNPAGWRAWGLPGIGHVNLGLDPRSATAIRAVEPHWAETLSSRQAQASKNRPAVAGKQEQAGSRRQAGSDTALTEAEKSAAPIDPSDKVEALHALILACLDEGQAEEVVSIPLAGKSAIADHMVIASGRSTRQVAALAQRIEAEAKAKLGVSVRTEGLASADWVLIDAKDVIVHLFRPEVRSFYGLEKMWAFDADGAPKRAADARP
jgi:nicotinate-nucleotide adenylyltransferase